MNTGVRERVVVPIDGDWDGPAGYFRVRGTVTVTVERKRFPERPRWDVRFVIANLRREVDLNELTPIEVPIRLDDLPPEAQEEIEMFVHNAAIGATKETSGSLR